MKIFKDVVIPLTVGVLVGILLIITYPVRWVIYKISQYIKKRKLNKNKIRL